MVLEGSGQVSVRLDGGQDCVIEVGGKLERTFRRAVCALVFAWPLAVLGRALAPGTRVNAVAGSNSLGPERTQD